jgi:multidrug resistance efflux pump
VLVRYLLPFSQDAVVSANRRTVRTTIDGILTHELKPGALVRESTVIAKVTDPQVDVRLLNELETRRQRLAGEISALEDLVRDLERVRGRLSKGNRALDNQRRRQLESSLGAAKATAALEKKTVALAEARLARTRELEASGVGTAVEVENANAELLLAESRLEVSNAELEALTASSELAASGAPVALPQHEVGTPYTAQRGDELDILLSVRSQELRSSQADLRATIEQLGREKSRVAKLESAELVVPVRSRVWQVFGTSGEFVKRGDPLFAVMDCSGAVVTAAVSERTFGRLHAGDDATFTADGSGKEYRGSVVQLIGPMSRGEGALLNPELRTSDIDKRNVVLLEFDELTRDVDEHCEIGQSGSVYFHLGARAWMP